MLEQLRASFNTYLHKLMGEFECWGLKAKVLSWWVREDETKVNVDDVTMGIQKDVAVVPATDSNHTVRRDAQANSVHPHSGFCLHEMTGMQNISTPI